MNRDPKNPYIEFPPMPTIIPGPPDSETLKGKVRLTPGPLPGLPSFPRPTGVGEAFAKAVANAKEPGSSVLAQDAPAPAPRAPRRPFPGYQGLQPHRLRQNPEEERFARAWAAENRDGRTLTYILCDGHEQHHPPTPSSRDFDVAATVVQWLGSPVGQTFLRDLGYEPPKEGPKQPRRNAQPFPKGHDTNDGPCECGAWHTPGDVLK